jgi:hypothetical protein
VLAAVAADAALVLSAPVPGGVLTGVASANGALLLATDYPVDDAMVARLLKDGGDDPGKLAAALAVRHTEAVVQVRRPLTSLAVLALPERIWMLRNSMSFAPLERELVVVAPATHAGWLAEYRWRLGMSEHEVALLLAEVAVGTARTYPAIDLDQAQCMAVDAQGARGLGLEGLLEEAARRLDALVPAEDG